MTKVKSKAEWVAAWKREARYLFGCYQCKADSQQYEKLRTAIMGVISEIEAIGELMEKEGTWEHAKTKISR